jgi:hypothetical protein
MKKFYLNTSWLKDPEDLLDAYSRKELLYQVLPEGQKILVSKKNQSITVFSAVGVNLTKRIKDLSQWKKIHDDYEIIAIMSQDREQFYAIDIIRLNDKDLTSIKFENRYKSLAKIDCEGAFNIIETKRLLRSDRISFSKSDFCALIRSKHSLLNNTGDAKTYAFLRDPNTRRVIIKDYYLGNRMGNAREVIFRCYQYRNDKLALVGKLRIDDEVIRKKMIQSIERKKRSVVLVNVDFDKRNKKKYSKLHFVSLIYDESFRKIVSDDELYFRPIVIVNIRAQKRTVVLDRTLCNNLNMLSGVI